MHSNRYTFFYAIAISIVTAVVLVVTSFKLKPLQDANKTLDTKKNILKSVGIETTQKAEIEKIFQDEIQGIVVDSKGDVIQGLDPEKIEMQKEVKKPVDEQHLPLYIYTDKDGKKNYILSVYGVGLWGPIWGFVALADDMETIRGTYFDHKGETPGLGAEIATKPFQDQFIGKSIYDNNHEYVSVSVLKKNFKSDLDSKNRVDAISGGTITSNGTSEMLKTGIKPYLAYLNKIKAN